MKKFLKWTAIVLGGLIIVIIAIILIIFIRHDRYTLFYPSGGILSENQAQYDVKYYELNLEINAQNQDINGAVTIKLKALTDNVQQVELDLIDNFTVHQVNDGLNFEHDGDKLNIFLDVPLMKGNISNIVVRYSGQPLEAIYPPWIGGFVWSQDSSGADWIGVACQGEGADIFFPCKDHPSDEPDSAAINITVPEPYYCVSNGLLRDISRPKEGFRTFHWFTAYPINNYNINISIGNYELVQGEYTAMDGSVMPVIYYVLPQSREGAEELVMMAIDMLETYRKFYGEYPFVEEKFGLVETPYLGMEHQTANAYGNNYNYRYHEDVEFDWLMLHEMGHEWWGNKVTAADFADFWIQEGICTYGEALYILDKAGEQAYHSYMRKIRGRINNQKPIIPGKNATTIDVYQTDIYTKGAYFMHTLRFLLGDDAFFKSLKEFATDSVYTYKNLVTTSDFLNVVNRNSRIDYSEFIHMFLYTNDLPEIVIDSVATDTYNIHIRNIESKLPMEISVDDSTYLVKLGKDQISLICSVVPSVDPQGWYFKKTFYHRSAFNQKDE